MAAPTVYKSSDASAPVLTGQVGSLIGVLDACLVNGYGSKAAAGWSKAFSGTNTASYRQASSGMYLDVNDNGAGAAGAQEANIRGYEAMTAVATGTNPFPTTSQRVSPGLYVRKSATADATARGWVLIADGSTFYLFVLSGDVAGRYQSCGFGSFFSFKSADAYKTFILAHTGTGSSPSGLDSTSLTDGPGSTFGGLYIARGQTGSGASITASLFGVGYSLWNNPLPGPNPEDGNVYISRLFLAEAANLRGHLRGLYQILTGSGLNDGDTFTGTGDFAGKSFVVLSHLSNSAVVVALETSAWDSSS